jgi:hypothetical protein
MKRIKFNRKKWANQKEEERLRAKYGENWRVVLKYKDRNKKEAGE